METITPVKFFIVAILEFLFLLISFVFIGLAVKELKKRKNVYRNLILLVTGSAFAIISIICAKILLFY